MLAAYYEGKQIALNRISYQRKNMVVNLERAVAENLNIVDILDYIFADEAKSKRKRAYEKQIQMSGFPHQEDLGQL